MREEIDEALGNITILFKKDGGIELDGKDKAVVELQALITKAQSEVLQAVREEAPRNIVIQGPDHGQYLEGQKEPIYLTKKRINAQWHAAINTVEKGLRDGRR